MTFEHFALNVPDARAQAQWWIAHLGCAVARKLDQAPHTHFLRDDTGRVIIELYTNPAAEVPDHASRHPLCFHVAFVAADARAEQHRLVAAGATYFSEDSLPDGSLLVMLRDPWGVPLQLCQRAKPMR